MSAKFTNLIMSGLWLMIIHHYTKFGYRMLSGSEDYFLDTVRTYGQVILVQPPNPSNFNMGRGGRAGV